MLSKLATASPSGSAHGSRAAFGGSPERFFRKSVLRASHRSVRRAVEQGTPAARRGGQAVRSPESERSKGAVDPGEDFFFSQNFEQMIEAWAGVAARNSKPGGMN